jgi:triphosphatase
VGQNWPALLGQNSIAELSCSLTVRQALAHILGHLLDVILAFAPAVAGPDGTEAVHQMRVAVRRARSALAVFRDVLSPGSFDDIRDGLKELGTTLGATRDWDVFALETIPAIQRLFVDNTALERIAVAADRRRQTARKDLCTYLAGPLFRRRTIQFACFTASSDWQAMAPDETSRGIA